MSYRWRAPQVLSYGSLFNAAGIFIEARTEAILGFLDALMELSEEKALVAEALRRGSCPC